MLDWRLDKLEYVRSYVTMSENSLEKIKEMIKQLSPEDRQNLIPFLAGLPDSGLESYDLPAARKTISW